MVIGKNGLLFGMIEKDGLFNRQLTLPDGRDDTIGKSGVERCIGSILIIDLTEERSDLAERFDLGSNLVAFLTEELSSFGDLHFNAPRRRETNQRNAIDQPLAHDERRTVEVIWSAFFGLRFGIGFVNGIRDNRFGGRCQAFLFLLREECQAVADDGDSEQSKNKFTNSSQKVHYNLFRLNC